MDNSKRKTIKKSKNQVSSVPKIFAANAKTSKKKDLSPTIISDQKVILKNTLSIENLKKFCHKFYGNTMEEVSNIQTDNNLKSLTNDRTSSFSTIKSDNHNFKQLNLIEQNNSTFKKSLSQTFQLCKSAFKKSIYLG